MDEEAWKIVPHWPDYEVSESGKLRRRTPGQGTHVGRELKGRLDHKGYRMFMMPGGKRERAHRLVAQTFVEPYEGDLVRHLDGNQANNHHSNLAWGTAMDNTNDRRRHGRRVGWHHLQTHCKWGHELSAKNVRWKKIRGREPYRLCLTCKRAELARRYARKRAA